MEIINTYSINSTTVRATLDEPETCPICKHAIKPQELHTAHYLNSRNERFIVSTYLCKHCYHPFVAHYSITDDIRPTGKIIFVEPNRFATRQFDNHISELSPSFVKIYNQALAAESSGLDEIAGIGYRKALEFLIKDFLISKSPEDEDKIKSMELGNCIANKVTNDNIKAVASRSAWLGNDQTHYVQRFEEYDVEDMKKFIEAAVYWISMELITAEALAIEPRGH